MLQNLPSLATPSRFGVATRVILLLACLLIPVTLIAARPDTVSAAPVTSSGWTTNGQSSSATVARGATVTVTFTVKSGSARSALIDLEVTSPASLVSQKYWDLQTFTAGQTRTYSSTWTAPSTATLGSYTVRVGVFGNGWSGLQHWNGNAASFTVSSSTTTTIAPTTTTTQPPTTTVAPTTTTLAPTTTTQPPTTTVAPTTTTQPPTTTTQPPATGHFYTLPLGAALPTEAQCASRVRRSVEIRSVNAVQNQTKGSRPNPSIPRVTGNFTGTTDEIIQWAACKWGIDEDIARAQIVTESYWKQATGGDMTSTQSSCHPSLRTTNGTACPESYGLGQVRYLYHTDAMDDSIRSSAYNLDYTYARWRTCFEGTQTWLNQFERGRDYVAGDLWGCVGLWFAGRWYTPAADGYIAAVQSNMNQRTWLTSSFINWAG